MPETIIQFVIPTEFSETYYKLCNLMANYGLDLLKDCKIGCDSKHIKLIECWNVFQSACAAYNTEQLRVADLLHTFVTEQLNLLYGEILPSQVDFRGATDEEIDNITDE